MMKAQSGYSGRSPKRKGCLLAVAIIITLPLALWATRTGWLPLIYKLFVVAEAPQKADFIVILGGGEGMRARTAARLYQEGYAPRILISGGFDTYKLDTLLMAELNIPSSDIFTNTEATTTWSEAQQILEILKREGAASAIIVTDGYHTRRVWAVYRRLQGDPPVRLIFVQADQREGDDPWSDGKALLNLEGELQKLVFYFFRYGVFPF